jgi:WhiB family transcriptional regulator, redox-sensing transcriptional regulator
VSLGYNFSVASLRIYYNELHKQLVDKQSALVQSTNMEELKLGDYTFKGDPYQEDWEKEAACRTARPDDLFVRGAEQHEAVRQNCADCPVQAACLRDAIEARVEWGVWGGLTERQRRQLVRKMGGFVNAITEIDHEIVKARDLRLRQNTYPEKYARFDVMERARRGILPGLEFESSEKQAS